MSVQVPPPPPTHSRPAAEDKATHLRLNQLLEEAAADSRVVIYSGTDYGIVTQWTTVRVTAERLDRHLRLYNCFQPLESLNSIAASDVENFAETV